MGDHPLAPCWAKAAHAERHLKKLHDEVSSYLGGEPLAVEGRIDIEAGAYIATVAIREPPPILWSLIAGDVVSNLRAALDHAVCRLVEVNGGKASNAHAFPILDSQPRPEQKARQWDDKIRGVGKGAEQIIEMAQPFSGGGSDPKETVMHSLRELSNEDKHRVLLGRYTTIPGRPGIPIRVGSCRDIEPIERVELYADRPLVDGAEIIRADVRITGPHPEAKIGGELPFDAGFGTPMVRLSGLAQMRDAVSGILLNLSEL